MNNKDSEVLGRASLILLGAVCDIKHMKDTYNNWGVNDRLDQIMVAIDGLILEVNDLALLSQLRETDHET